MRKALALLALCLVVTGCGGIVPLIKDACAPPTAAEIVMLSALLPEQEAKELRVHYDEHTDTCDARVHTGKSCPFLVYLPKKREYQAGELSPEKYAKFLHGFYEAKHDEEGDCDCDEMLGD